MSVCAMKEDIHTDLVIGILTCSQGASSKEPVPLSQHTFLCLHSKNHAERILVSYRKAKGKCMRKHLIWPEFMNIKANWVLWTASLLHVWLVQVAARPSPTSVNLQIHKRTSLMKHAWSVADDLTTETIISHQLLVLVYTETVTPHSG